MAFVTHMRLAFSECEGWFDYAPSAANIADIPARLDAAAFARLERVARRRALVLPPEWCLLCGHPDCASLIRRPV